MNRKFITAFLAVVAAVGLFFGYRAYKLSADRELAQQRAAAELALARQHQEEMARRSAAMVEARRMAEARAKEEMARLDRIREEQEAAQAALKAAEAELARLEAERNAAGTDADRLAAARARDSATADAARLAAIEKLRALDLEKRSRAPAPAGVGGCGGAPGRGAGEECLDGRRLRRARSQIPLHHEAGSSAQSARGPGQVTAVKIAPAGPPPAN